MDHEMPLVLAIAIPLAIFVGPLLMGFIGWRGMRGRARRDQFLPRFRHVAVSAICFTLAYNLAYFWQEVWLVVPKALTPGLQPYLFHNNHYWEGDAPIAALWQGTGAFAIIVTAMLLIFILRHAPPRRAAWRLLLTWGVLLAMMQGLLQVPIGVMDPGTDVGQAMEYLGWPQWFRLTLSVIALAALPVVARATVPHFLAIGPQPVSNPTRRIMWICVYPAIAGLAMTVPFRWPAELGHLIISPIIATSIGLAWVLALSWTTRARSGVAPARTAAFPWSWLLFLLALLAFFQLVLRPGVAF